jgi:hypothetical protein
MRKQRSLKVLLAVIFASAVPFCALDGTALGVQKARLIQADEIAKELIERVVYSRYRQSDLKDAGVLFDPRGAPDYVDIIQQFYAIKKQYGGEYLKRTLIDVFGYDGGNTVMYIVDNIVAWKDMKGLYDLKK